MNSLLQQAVDSAQDLHRQTEGILEVCLSVPQSSDAGRALFEARLPQQAEKKGKNLIPRNRVIPSDKDHNLAASTVFVTQIDKPTKI